MLTLPVWLVLTFRGSAPLPFCPEKGITQTHRKQFCIVYSKYDIKGGDNSYKIDEAVMEMLYLS